VKSPGRKDQLAAGAKSCLCLVTRLFRQSAQPVSITVAINRDVHA
jgi:hypothetical protein